MLAAEQHKWELQLNLTKSAFKGLKRKSPEGVYYVQNHLFFNRKQVPFYLGVVKEQNLLIQFIVQRLKFN